MRTRRLPRFLVLAVLAATSTLPWPMRSVAGEAAAGTATIRQADSWSWDSAHRVRARFEPSVSPVPLVALHSWTVHLRGADDRPIDGADVTIAGGMPEHAHGLPTVPVVTPLGEGTYRIEGMKFHMPGHWIVLLHVRRGADNDTVAFALDVP